MHWQLACTRDAVPDRTLAPALRHGLGTRSAAICGGHVRVRLFGCPRGAAPYGEVAGCRMLKMASRIVSRTCRGRRRRIKARRRCQRTARRHQATTTLVAITFCVFEKRRQCITPRHAAAAPSSSCCGPARGREGKKLTRSAVEACIPPLRGRRGMQLMSLMLSLCPLQVPRNPAQLSTLASTHVYGTRVCVCVSFPTHLLEPGEQPQRPLNHLFVVATHQVLHVRQRLSQRSTKSRVNSVRHCASTGVYRRGGKTPRLEAATPWRQAGVVTESGR